MGEEPTSYGIESKQSDEEQWYEVWEILFPNTTRPNSVYLDRTFSDAIFLIQEYMREDGVTILLNCLNAQDAIQWTLPDNEGDLISFQNRVARGVLEELFEGLDASLHDVNTQQSAIQTDSALAIPPNGSSQVLKLSDTSTLGASSASGATHACEEDQFYFDVLNARAPSEHADGRVESLIQNHLRSAFPRVNLPEQEPYLDSFAIDEIMADATVDTIIHGREVDYDWTGFGLG